MNFLKFKTPEELKQKTGLSVKQALVIVENELEELKKQKT